MDCSQCHKLLTENEFYTLAKTHGKLFIVKGSMKGSYDTNTLAYCEKCAKQIKLSL